MKSFRQGWQEVVQVRRKRQCLLSVESCRSLLRDAPCSTKLVRITTPFPYPFMAKSECFD
eukprot:6189919-Pleurochrysis_carterae.AAC.1